MNASQKDNKAVSVLPAAAATTVSRTSDTSATIKTNDIPTARLRRKAESSEEARGCQLIRDALTPYEIAHLADDGMVLRHYRAEKGNVDSAISKIKSTIKWRREFGVADIVTCFDDLDDDYLKPLRDTFREEAKTGKLYVRGRDRGGRAIQYMAPGRENTNNETNQMKFLVYNLERAVACTAAEQARRKDAGMQDTINPGEEKICIIINFDQWTLRKSPPMSTTLYTLEILQRHYCERLHRAYVFNPPKFFVCFWNLIHRFVDPVTKDKIQFCTGAEGLKRIEQDIDLSNVEDFVGGTGRVHKFDSEEYLLKYPHSSTFGEDPSLWRRAVKERGGNVVAPVTWEDEKKEDEEDDVREKNAAERGSFRRCNSHSLFTGTF